MLESAPDAIVICDETGIIVLVNRRAEKLFGYGRERMVAAPVDLLIPRREDEAADPGGWFAQLRSHAAAGRPIHARRADGVEFPVELRLNPLHTGEGQLIPIAISDVTERVRAAEARAWLAAIVDSSSEAIIGLGPDGSIQSWNAGAERLYGHLPADVIGRPATILMPADFTRERERLLGQVLGGQMQSIHLETEDVTKDGERIAVALTASPIRDGAGMIVGIARITRDIAERKRLEAELAYNADHDPLTGLFNRRRFGLELNKEVAHAARYPGTAGSLLLADVDHFKYVNDTLGHRTGDAVLREVAKALRRRLRETDVIARVGGDEFAVILTHTHVDAAHTVARSLCETVRGLAPNAADHAVRATLSIGVAPLGGGLTGDDSMAVADMAMYEAKRQGRDRVGGFTATAEYAGEGHRWSLSLDAAEPAAGDIRARRSSDERAGEAGSVTPT